MSTGDQHIKPQGWSFTYGNGASASITPTLRDTPQHDERRVTRHCELRIKGNDAPVIQGYAAVFDSPTMIADVRYGAYREVIKPGAFTASLERKDDVRGLWEHESKSIVGRTSSGTLTLAQDDHGLLATMNPPDTQDGRDLVTLIKRGDLSQMSFGFRVPIGGEEWASDGAVDMRTIITADVFDVSVVAFPAYEDTEVGLRSRDRWRDVQRKAIDTSRRTAARLRLAGIG